MIVRPEIRTHREGQMDRSIPLRACEGVLFEEVDGELVVLNLTTGKYYGLNSVATRMWHLLEEHNPERVLEVLLDEFDVDAGQLESDLDEFCSELLELGFLEQAK